MSNAHPLPSEKTQVIHVSGDDRQIGRQHAEQVGDRFSRGMVNFYVEFWHRLFDQKSDHWIEHSLMKGVKYLIDPILVGRLFKQIPRHAKERMAGIEEVTQIKKRDLTTALILPDLLPILQAYAGRLRPDTIIEVSPPPKLGCTSFVYRGDKFLYGRNLDFPGVGYWDRFPVIQSTARSGCLRYIGFTTAGVPLCGITGINEAQISVSLHQHYCKEVLLRGTLPYIIAEEVLSRATTLDKAISIIKEYSVSSSWAFVVTDGKTRDGFIFERHPWVGGIRQLLPNERGISHSNYFQTSECQPSEYAATARMNWDNHCRKARLDTLIDQYGSSMEPRHAVQIISEHYDPYWGEEKISNRTISQLINIQSLVLDPVNMKVYFCEGDAPIHLREFREYDLGEILSGKEGRRDTAFPAYTFRENGIRVAKESHVLGAVFALEGKIEQAINWGRRGLEAHFSAEGAFSNGVLLLKAGALGEADELFTHAKEYLEEKARIRNKKLPPEYFEICLFAARTKDLRGQRSEALSLYRHVEGHSQLEDSHIRKLAKQAGPFTTQKLTRIVAPFSAYIPFL